MVTTTVEIARAARVSPPAFRIDDVTIEPPLVVPPTPAGPSRLVPILAVATMVGVRSVDPRLLEMARSFRAGSWQLITRVEVPAALPAILGGMRVGVTLAVIGAIVGEWAGANQGLGVLINIARGSLFDIPLMFAALLQLAIIGVTLYLVMLFIERRLVGER